MKDEKRYISMLSDYGFKLTFANQSDTTFLRKAIQALIGLDTSIKSVTFNRNEITSITIDSRGGLYDMTCTDENGVKYIIEMQVLNTKHFIHRAKFYGFFHYNTMVKKGKYTFNDLTKIYVISILGEIAYPNIEEYHQINCLRNQHGDIVDDQITHVLVELGKWNKSLEEVKKSNKDIDKLLYIMKMTDELTIAERVMQPDFIVEDWIDKAIEELDKSKMTAEERAYAEMKLAQEASIAYYYEEEKKKAVQEVEAVKAEIELAKNQAEVERDRVEAELNQAEAERNRVEAELKAEKEKATIEKRNGHKLLVRSLLEVGVSIEKVAAMQGWKVEYVIELKNEIEQN